MITVEVDERRVTMADGSARYAPRQLALLLEAVIAARGRCVTIDHMCDVLWPNPADQPLDARKAIQVQVCNARKIVGRGVIENVHGAGYRLASQETK